MLILKKTSDIIHMCLQNALSDPQTKTLIDFLENFRQELNSSVEDIPEENLRNFFVFMDGLRATLYYHLRRSEITNFARNLSITLVYLALWRGFSAESLARFKSVISDIRKDLDKSFEGTAPANSVHEKKIEELSSDVRDRVGCRLVVNTHSKTDLFNLWTSLIEILGGFNPITKAEFINWYANKPNIPASHKRAIREVLSVPVSVGHYKNYVNFPKPNGYESLQATMTIQFYSPVLPGLQFELQVRSNDMDEVAVFGSAAHQVYKQNKLMHKIISIEDPTVTLRLKEGLNDFIPLCHCRISPNGSVEVTD